MAVAPAPGKVLASGILPYVWGGNGPMGNLQLASDAETEQELQPCGTD